MNASFKNLKVPLNPDEYDDIVNYFNGVRIKIKEHQIIIVKSSDSKCSNDFTFTLDDVMQGGQRNIMTERFNLFGGDYRIIQIAEPDSDHCDIKTTRTINLKYSVDGEDMIYHKVISEKYPFLKDWNVVGAIPSGRPEAEMAASGAAADEPGKLWTPGSESAGGGKLWVPE